MRTVTTKPNMLSKRQLPNTIHAVTAEGFELEVFLFVLAVSFGALV